MMGRMLVVVGLATLFCGCPWVGESGSEEAARMTVGEESETLAARIVFASNRDGDYDIYTMSPDGSDVVRLTNNDEDEFEPVWSPDGTRIAFVKDVGMIPGTCDLFVMDSTDADGDGNGDNLERLTELTMMESDVREPAWVPNGLEIVVSVYAGLWQIYKVDVETKTHAQITFGTENDRAPTFMPLGYRILIARGERLFTIEVDGTPVGDFDTQVEHDYDPAMALNGKWVAYSGGGLGAGDFSSICIEDTEEGTLVQVLSAEGITDRSPSWSPTGRYIAFEREIESGGPGPDSCEIVIVEPDGEVPIVQPMGQLGFNRDPDWRPQKTSLYVRNYSLHDINEVWVGRFGAQNELLTDDLSFYVPNDAEHPDRHYNDEMLFFIPRHPEPSIWLDYIYQKTQMGDTPIYGENPIRTPIFRPGILHVPGYGLVRETLFLHDPGSYPRMILEQLIRGRDAKLYVYRPSGFFFAHPEVGEGPILLQTLLDEGYHRYEPSQLGP